jgi:SPP1 family predicted phage head-tail adaptor
MEPEINAGDLDRRVTLLRPVYADDNYQDEIASWEPAVEVWAAVNPEKLRELNEASRTVSETGVPIVIRYRPGIDARWRVREREREYEITSIVDIARRHVQLQLNCEEVQ